MEGTHSVCVWTDPLFGYDPEDLRLDPVLLKDKVHDYVSAKDLEALEESQMWWDSSPDEMQVYFEASAVNFLNSGVLPDPQGEQETGKKKKDSQG